VGDLEETVQVLNQPQHGLVASIYTGNRENYVRLAEEVRVGMLHWNRPTVQNSYKIPYGGVKKSGSGRPMGSFAAHQLTYPVSSLEYTGDFKESRLPETLPRLESKE
jgi:succinylglutamic semialdehyde dehydrogenase